jgi:hypothetical protein
MSRPSLDSHVDEITLNQFRTRLQCGACDGIKANRTAKLRLLPASNAPAIAWLHLLTDLYVNSLPKSHDYNVFRRYSSSPPYHYLCTLPHTILTISWLLEALFLEL